MTCAALLFTYLFTIDVRDEKGCNFALWSWGSDRTVQINFGLRPNFGVDLT